MNFDRIAPYYDYLEQFFSLGQLQRCRVCLMDELHTPHEVLLVGDGTGRCLEQLMVRFPQARFTCLDNSMEMINLAKARVSYAGLDVGTVSFTHGDAQTVEFPIGKYDLIVTPFFFDCFTERQIKNMIHRLDAASSDQAQWLVADFHLAAKGPARWLGLALLWALYRFFALTSDVKARQLISPAPYLQAKGFTVRSRATLCLSLLQCDLWEKCGDPLSKV